MSDLVTITKTDGVADVRLNRPDKYNALSGEMFEAIIAAGESLRDAKDVRAIVLSGNGRGFCAGLDFSSFQGMAGSYRTRAARQYRDAVPALGRSTGKSRAAAGDDLEAFAGAGHRRGSRRRVRRRLSDCAGCRHPHCVARCKDLGDGDQVGTDSRTCR